MHLLVIMPRTRQRGERMSVRIRHAVPRDFLLDLLVRTPAEVTKRLLWGDFFLREIIERGEVLYEATRVSGSRRPRMTSRSRVGN